MMKKIKYKHIWFDLDNTIFDFNRSSKIAFNQLIKHIGLENSSTLYQDYQVINHKVWEEMEKGLITQTALRSLRWDRFFTKIGIAFDPAKANDLYLSFLATNNTFIPFAVETVHRLSKTYTLVAVTNGLKEVQKSRMENASLNKYFDNLIISDEIGVAKPNIEFFEIAHRFYPDLKKEEILMVGDRLSSDILGAQNYNIDSCWFNPNEDENNLTLKPRFEIKDMNALVNILLI